MEKGNLKWFFVAAISASMIPFVRYMGASYIAGGALTVLFLIPGRKLKRVLRAFSFWAVASLPIFCWLWRNFFLIRPFRESGTKFTALMFHGLIGPNEPLPEEVNGFWLHLKMAFDAMRLWVKEIVRFDVSSGFALLFTVVFIVVTAIVLWIFLRRSSFVERGALTFANILWINGVGAIVFLAWVLTFQGLVGEAFPNRYLIPAYTHFIPLFFLTLFMLFLVLRKRSKLAGLCFKVLFLCVMLAWSCFAGPDAYKRVTHVREAGTDESKGKIWHYAKNEQWFPKKK